MKFINILPNLDLIIRYHPRDWAWERGFLCYEPGWPQMLPQMHYIHAGPVEIRWWRWETSND